jgi:hypothetical protein
MGWAGRWFPVVGVLAVRLGAPQRPGGELAAFVHLGAQRAGHGGAGQVLARGFAHAVKHAQLRGVRTRAAAPPARLRPFASSARWRSFASTASGVSGSALMLATWPQQRMEGYGGYAPVPRARVGR